MAGEHTIAEVVAHEILDSRGNPTVEVDVTLGSGTLGRASVPSAPPRGSEKPFELRDGDKGRYLGKGVSKAVHHVNREIRQTLVGLDATSQATSTRH